MPPAVVRLSPCPLPEPQHSLTNGPSLGSIARRARWPGVKKSHGGVWRTVRSCRSRGPALCERNFVTHHVGGYLKIAPEHTTEDGPLSKMMKPGIGNL